jgi:DNA-3-methyladenine glycosylase II
LKLLDLGLFESFCYWIIGQQLSVRAADSIIGRFLKLVVPLTPENLLTIEHDKLRSVGLSNSKAEYVKNVAQFLIDNDDRAEINSPNEFSSEDLRKFFMQIRGVGPWTVNMHLIFILGKLDVFAIKDLGVKKGIKILYDLPDLPKERLAISDYSDNWGDLATIGTLLSWNVLEEDF